MHPDRSARDIVANPDPADSAFLRFLAWCALKSERGQPVVQSRLGRRGVAG